MDKLTRAFALTVADLLSFLAVDVAQPVQIEANEDRMERRGRRPEPSAQEVRAEISFRWIQQI